jgi:hypothetical protein
MNPTQLEKPLVIWTADNTPNGVFVPSKERGYVALFYKPGAPTRMNPGQLMLMENYTGGISRNLTHWGFYTSPIATRAQTDEEHNHVALCGRALVHYYQDWDKLIADEVVQVASCPRIGTAFLEQIRKQAVRRSYRLRPMPQVLEAGPEELETAEGTILEPDEKALVLETARQMGLTREQQLTLFDTAA